MADNSIGVIGYTTDETSKIEIPYRLEMGREQQQKRNYLLEMVLQGQQMVR